LIRISIFDHHFDFRSIFRFFIINFDFRSKIWFSIQISIFDQNFNFRSKFRFSIKSSILSETWTLLGISSASKWSKYYMKISLSLVALLYGKCVHLKNGIIVRLKIKINEHFKKIVKKSRTISLLHFSI